MTKFETPAVVISMCQFHHFKYIRLEKILDKLGCLLKNKKVRILDERTFILGPSTAV
jgi:hypothetical protein